jgi:aldehyde dehydrogenase (NAD+)
MDIIKPTNGQVIARVTLADEEDTRRAIAIAKTAFASFGRSTKEERAKILRRLHEAASARQNDLTAVMVEEYGGTVQFAGLLVQSGINAFLAAEQALQELPLTRSWVKTTVTLEPVGVAGLITAWNANALFICLKLASAVAAGCTVITKPSELSSLQTQVLVEALHEANLPKGLLNVVTGRGNVVGAELVRNPDVTQISFIGSVAVGESIMRDKGENHEARHTGTRGQVAHHPARRRRSRQGDPVGPHHGLHEQRPSLCSGEPAILVEQSLPSSYPWSLSKNRTSEQIGFAARAQKLR